MNYPAYEKTNEDIYKDYVNPDRKDFQNLNCHILINRLNKGDMSALEVLRKIGVLGAMNSSIYSHPKTFLGIVELYSRSNEDIYNEYAIAENIEAKTRDCNILIYRALDGDNEAFEKLKLVALDEIISTSYSRQANNALDKMNKS